MKSKQILKLSTAAILVALAFILTRFFSLMLLNGVFRLDIGFVPVELAGFLLGPFFGFVVGAVSDLLGAIMHGGATIHLGITLDLACIGASFGLYRWIAGQKAHHPLLLLLWTLFTTLVFHWGTRSLWLSQLQHLPYITVLGTRLIPVLLNGAVCYVLLLVLVQAIQRSHLAIKKL